MSKELKDRYFSYYQRTPGEDYLIDHISELHNMYIRRIGIELAKLDEDADRLNKSAVINGDVFKMIAKTKTGIYMTANTTQV